LGHGIRTCMFILTSIERFRSYGHHGSYTRSVSYEDVRVSTIISLPRLEGSSDFGNLVRELKLDLVYKAIDSGKTFRSY
jgi:hypothetical protein